MAENFDESSHSDDGAGEWNDVTDLFSKARDQLNVGEMIHLESFSLFASMSAIELGDPKMDIGCGKPRAVADVDIPQTLTLPELIVVMDNLFACELTWLNAHTLPQTVFSCLYHQRISCARQLELLSFMRLQLGTMRLILNIVQAEKIADEEDFICWTYGFRLPPLTESKGLQIWNDISKHLASGSTSDSTEDAALRSGILDRLRFRWVFFQAICALLDPKCSRLPLVLELVTEAEKLLRIIHATKVDEGEHEELLKCVFDASLNKHLLTNSPPRTVPLLSVAECFESLKSILAEFRGLCNLKKSMLPQKHSNTSNGTSSSPGNSEQYSFQNAINALGVFCARHKPSLLSRCILKRMLLCGDGMLNVKAASFDKMLLTDMGVKIGMEIPKEIHVQIKTLVPFAEHFVWSLCRNRGRQRRCLVKSLANWDQAVELCFRKRAQNDDTISEGAESDLTSEVFCGKTPLQLVCHEISARMMVQHFLLGFECDLYLPYEYSTVYFYVGYILATAANATASIAASKSSRSDFQSPRFVLYQLDEGRLWLCRALYSLFDVLMRCDMYDFKSHFDGGSKTFASESLWYEQRFGFNRLSATGPSYVDNRTFRALMKSQEKSLMEKCETDDPIVARLNDAANCFTTARRALEQASTTCKQFGWDEMSMEVRDLARVAISNSVLVNQQQRIHSVWKLTDEASREVGCVRANLLFKHHRHFPVVEITSATST